MSNNSINLCLRLTLDVRVECHGEKEGVDDGDGLRRRTESVSIHRFEKNKDYGIETACEVNVSVDKTWT